MRTRFSTGMYCSVRMLCSRSASLTTTMRQSSAIAMNIERKFSTCSSALVRMSSSTSAGSSIWARTILGSFDTFVSPSTILRTVGPKSDCTSSKVSAVSSTVSWRRPAQSVALSICVFAKMIVTATGWVMYGSPLRRVCPRCVRNATSSARRTCACADGRRYVVSGESTMSCSAIVAISSGLKLSTRSRSHGTVSTICSAHSSCDDGVYAIPRWSSSTWSTSAGFTSKDCSNLVRPSIWAAGEAQRRPVHGGRAGPRNAPATSASSCAPIVLASSELDASCATVCVSSLLLSICAESAAGAECDARNVLSPLFCIDGVLR